LPCSQCCGLFGVVREVEAERKSVSVNRICTIFRTNQMHAQLHAIVAKN
jgi:hypothetical protein